ncbi:uncharacterized protein LOC119081434 isoform X2 [Bradysia coprophila]|uniref:uncharacterized protein LOC119081434 isoform X2 n=1 Tax=Bradysia coprophila TaxID=38358 RepID=UPI00187DB1BD|nr:uncharacterized protein LOC119081434 isoform X2 [Bradysia coprophila]
MTATQKDIKEMKSLNRALEDIRDNLLEIKIEKALNDKELEGTDELLANETARNLRMIKRVEEMCQLADEENAKSDRFIRTSLSISKGTLASITSFTEGKLKEFKVAKNLRKANMEKKLSDEIDAYVRSHPSVKNLHQNEVQQVEDERTLKRITEEVKVLRSSRRSVGEMSDAMFQLSVVDFSTLILRYRALTDQLKNPNAEKVARGKQMRMFMSMRMLRLPSPAVPSAAGGNENNDQTMSEIASSYTHQELDTGEAPEAMSAEPSVLDPLSGSTQDSNNTFDRGSFSRSAMRVKRSDESDNTKRSTSLKTPTQLAITQNARVETQVEEVVSRQSQRAMPITGSFKAPADQSSSSQKTKKAKVTFAEYESSSSEADVSKYVRASSSNAHAPHNENQSSFNDEISPDSADDVQLNGYDEMDLQIGNQNDFEIQDDFDDQISNWTSLDPNGMDSRGVSPTPNFEDMFNAANTLEDDEAQENPEQPTDHDGFGFNFENSNAADLFE